MSACGGTHVTHTGEIGPIAVRGWERFKGGTRLEFVCGGRTLTAFRELRDTVTASSRLLSVLPHELSTAIGRLQEEARDLRRSQRDLQAELAGFRAAALAASAGDDRRAAGRARHGARRRRQRAQGAGRRDRRAARPGCGPRERRAAGHRGGRPQQPTSPWTPRRCSGRWSAASAAKAAGVRTWRRAAASMRRPTPSSTPRVRRSPPPEAPAQRLPLPLPQQLRSLATSASRARSVTASIADPRTLKLLATMAKARRSPAIVVT